MEDDDIRRARFAGIADLEVDLGLEPQLDGARDLVDVLSATTLSPDAVKGDLFQGNRNLLVYINGVVHCAE